MPPMRSSASRCSGVASRPITPPSAMGSSPARFFSRTVWKASTQPLRVGLDVFEQLIDERQEVRAQPRHAGELRAVRGLVQRQPQPELARRERIATLHRGHVGADVVHDVLEVGIFFFDDEQVVLTEHTRRHPTEHHAELDATHATGDRRQPARRDLRLHLFEQGPQQRRNDATLASTHIARSATCARAGPGQRTKPGLGGDELLRLARSARRSRTASVGSLIRGLGEGLAGAGARRDFAGELPIDSGRHVGPNYCCFLG